MSPEASAAADPAGHHTRDRLVYMANQIAGFFETQGGGTAAEDTATHLRRFWEPRMRAAIIAHLEAGGAGLEETARAAVALLGQRAKAG
ncbi:MAG: formate dehydrogenase subunit delta [Acetobacteraceae bacterium]